MASRVHAVAALATLSALFALAATACGSAAPDGAPAARTTSSSASSSAIAPRPATDPHPTEAASPSPTAVSTSIPPVSAAARADGLLDVRTVVPDAIIDLRYATADNFTHVQLYPGDARCLVHESMAPGLATAAERLRAQGYILVFWDCYRPHAVQIRMFQVVPDPAWVARPGPYARSHEAGRSVDVTLAVAAAGSPCAASRADGHCLLDMGTGFDDFTSRAHAFATDVGATAQRNRALLRDAMGAGGLQVYSGEWWHFDGPGAGVDRPVLGAPVN